MNLWVQKRKLTLFVVILFGLFVFLAVGWRILFYERASCADGKQNNGERGIDCSGSCPFFCPNEVTAPLIRFARAVLTENGVWGAVASVENPASAGARGAPFVFKLYDKNNLLVAERHGEAYIPPQKVFAIFEGAMVTGDRAPVRAIFEFTEPPRFERFSLEPLLVVSSQHFLLSADGARLEAVLRNMAGTSLPRVVLTALLFGRDSNVFAASQTEILGLRASGSAAFSFTWPRQLQEPARIEILYTVPDRGETL